MSTNIRENCQPSDVDARSPHVDPKPEVTAKAPASNRAALIRTHSDLVRHIAYRMVRRLPHHVEVDDLIQAGFLGLLEAADQYLPSKGALFTTFAGLRIRGAMLDFMRKGNWSPRRVYRQQRHIACTKRRIENETGEIARPAAVAATLGMSLEAYHRAEHDAVVSRQISMEEMSRDETTTLSDSIPDKRIDVAAEVEHDDWRRALASAIDTLPARERLILLLHYDEEMNLRDIGEQLQLSESRICQICKEAVERLGRIARNSMRRPELASQKPPIETVKRHMSVSTRHRSGQYPIKSNSPDRLAACQAFFLV